MLKATVRPACQLSLISAILFSTCTFAGSIEKHPQPTNTMSVHITGLAIVPGADHLNYAVYVAGRQPTQQSWANQSVDPGFSAAFEIGTSILFHNAKTELNFDWTHLRTSDWNSKQANPLAVIEPNIEFVAPPYDVGPATFAIKHAKSNVKFAFDDASLTASRELAITSRLHAHILYGVKFLRFKKTVTTTFDQNNGAQATAISLAVPPDPNWYFITENVSKFLGAGTDAGINVSYDFSHAFGVVGQAVGILAIGSQSQRDNFKSQATTAGQVQQYHQYISMPNFVKVIPGLAAKFGFTYSHHCLDHSIVKLEAGYRINAYLNAFTDVSPATLVQRGNAHLPEFVTGIMAINSTQTTNSLFNFSGFYFDLSYLY